MFAPAVRVSRTKMVELKAYVVLMVYVAQGGCHYKRSNVCQCTFCRFCILRCRGICSRHMLAISECVCAFRRRAKCSNYGTTYSGTHLFVSRASEGHALRGFEPIFKDANKLLMSHRGSQTKAYRRCYDVQSKRLWPKTQPPHFFKKEQAPGT